MDLIEVLWKQDVDLGFSLEFFNGPAAGAQALPEPLADEAGEETGKKKDERDPWAGLPYTVDSETGEYPRDGRGEARTGRSPSFIRKNGVSCETWNSFKI
ncbi:hypothetical protein FOCC_FOCC011102 [Frankliniella occidentalis]|nr:hypothetical protein FOCC_FOCC011102 [Frankliniella occidentalis]